MAITLQDLLDDLDPAHNLDETQARADAAINSFDFPDSTRLSWSEFVDVMVRFHRHVEYHVLNLTSPMDGSFHMEWSRCVTVLLREYGPNGEKTAYDLARSGSQGGLYRVLERLADGIARHYAQTEIVNRIEDFWSRLSVTQQAAVVQEYLNRYGSLLPAELTDGSAARVRAEFRKILAEHPRLIHRLRQVPPP